MKKLLARFIFLFIVAIATTRLAASAQNAVTAISAPSFSSDNNLDRIQDTLKKQFETKKLAFPPKEIYVRSFKYDKTLEIWVKSDLKENFKLFKTYHVCMQSGTMGPKRMEGDFQVPEGFYYINEFNPNSNYHLALGLNYPNASDRILSDSMHLRPGGGIYIHGNCVSTGCIAISDAPVEEVYLLATYAKAQGQDFIPVHVFPVKYNVKKSMEYLAQTTKDNQPLQHFAVTLKEAFDYFEEKKELPIIMIDKKGDYVIQ
ncbi:L,D-transpeptidase family protein [Ferruginibacter albus]|uniref:L,D-transpeptidase family protein n=1 Tax=Ferruginibacter albus TaxID=2875540 RepID=UPI001CC5DBD3|nr:L,D-transpeptidase family protein [Ferruginibacter albus]UAY52796.1 L,D-transpeptidase family protein [Ferruginibacter albus]